MHSWLIVPAASEAKLGKVAAVGADVVLLDLTGDYPDAARDAAREQAREFLALHGARAKDGPRFARWARISSLDTPWWRDDLVAVLPGGPDGIVLSRAADPRQVQALAAEIYELEQRSGLEHGRVRIVPQVGASPAAALAITEFAGEVHPRLAGLAWDASELAASLCTRRLRTDDGAWSDPFRRVRADVLLAARARGLMAIDTPSREVRAASALRAAAASARGDGFTGLFAIHPAQVPAIAEAFAPTAAECAQAQAILALFEGRPEANTLPHEGRMVGRDELEEARRLLG